MQKTQGIHELVSEIIGTILEPHHEDIIEDMWLAIESQPAWLRQYDELVLELRSKDTVNNWIGKYVKKITGGETLSEGNVVKHDITIVKFYTKLRF